MSVVILVIALCVISIRLPSSGYRAPVTELWLLSFGCRVPVAELVEAYLLVNLMVSFVTR